MIHVQIASDVTAGGVEGVRWVLIESIDGAPPGPTLPPLQPLQPMPPAIQALPLPALAPNRPWRLALWKLLVIGLGLVAALLLGRARLGDPGLPGLAWPAADVSPGVAPSGVETPRVAPPNPAPGAATSTDGLPTTPDATGAAPDGLPATPAAPVAPNPPAAPAASAALPDRLITADLR